MSIPQETIDEIRSRARIEDIILRYVPSLKKRGSSYIGLCPFHKEKTPSFSVSPQKQIFHCFGCNAGGNVFTFISMIENVNFPESVKIAGNYVGITVNDKKTDLDNELDYLYRTNEFCLKVFKKYFNSENGIIAANYLEERGLSPEIIEKFEIGFVPDSWDFLKNMLINKGISLDKAVEAGVLSKKEETSRYYDRFRGRVMFPIYNKFGRVAAFGGRVINDGEPKYLNSPESPIFKKGEILYGLNQAKDSIRDCKRAIVVEGYMDVIGCFQVGIENCVAPLGTALTEKHIEYLSRFASEIVLLFDSDQAGINAAIRSLSKANHVNVTIKIAQLEEGDPFDFAIEKGIRQLMALVDSAMPPVEFRINRIIKDNRSLPDFEIVEKIFEVINELSSEIEKKKYLKMTASLLKLDMNDVIKDYSNFSSQAKRPVENTNRINRNIIEKYNFIDKSYSDLIMLLINYPFLIKKAEIDFSKTEIQNIILKNIYEVVIHNDPDNFNPSMLFDQFNLPDEKNVLSKLLGNNFSVEDPDAAYTEIYINLKLHNIDNKINFYYTKINNDRKHSIEYLTEIEILRREKEKLHNYIYNVQSNSQKESVYGF